eukprot:gene5903-4218_t
MKFNSLGTLECKERTSAVERLYPSLDPYLEDSVVVDEAKALTQNKKDKSCTDRPLLISSLAEAFYVNNSVSVRHQKNERETRERKPHQEDRFLSYFLLMYFSPLSHTRRRRKIRHFVLFVAFSLMKREEGRGVGSMAQRAVTSSILSNCLEERKENKKMIKKYGPPNSLDPTRIEMKNVFEPFTRPLLLVLHQEVSDGSELIWPLQSSPVVMKIFKVEGLPSIFFTLTLAIPSRETTSAFFRRKGNIIKFAAGVAFLGVSLSMPWKWVRPCYYCRFFCGRRRRGLG